MIAQKATYEAITLGLDQLFFMASLPDQDRAYTIESFLAQNGWNWDMVLNEMVKENDNG